MAVFFRRNLAFLPHDGAISHDFSAFNRHFQESVDGKVLPPEAGEDEPKKVHPVRQVVSFETPMARHEVLQEPVDLVDPVHRVPGIRKAPRRRRGVGLLGATKP